MKKKSYIQSYCTQDSQYKHNMGLDARNPVFGVCGQIRFNPTYSATKTNKNIQNFACGKFRCYTFEKSNNKSSDQFMQAGLRHVISMPKSCFSRVEAHIKVTGDQLH